MTRHVAARGAIGRVAESRLSPSDGPRGRARRATPGFQGFVGRRELSPDKARRLTSATLGDENADP